MQYELNELTILSALCHPSENVKIHGKCETYIYLADTALNYQKIYWYR